MSCPATSSGLKVADAAILTAAGKLKGVHLIGNGTDACSVIIYDNASAASGTVLAKIALPASGDAYVDAHLPEGGVAANNGLYADVTGTDAAYIVLYDLG